MTVDDPLAKHGCVDHLFAAFVVIMLLILFLAPVCLENRTLVDSSDIFKVAPWDMMKPPGWYGSPGIDGSPTYLFHPADLLARDIVRRGSVAGWNQYNGFGAPWIGAMQTAPYYPPKLLEYVLPFWDGANLIRLMLLFTAGMGTYLLAISLDIEQGPAIVCAAAYMFCERLFLMMNMPTFHIETLLPLMLFAVHRASVTRSLGWAIGAGWICGAQFLGGFPESSFIFCVVSLSFYLFLMLGQEYRPYWKRLLSLGACIAGTSILMSGFQLAEFVRYLSAADHVHVRTFGSVVKAPMDLIRLFVPGYFGGVAAGPWDHVDMSLFCGVTTILLAMVGLLGGKTRYRWFFGGCLTVFLGYDFGFPILRQIGRLPLFDVMSISWNVFVIPFCLSILAGFGLQATLSVQRIRWRLGLAIVLCAIIPGALMLYMSGSLPDMRSLAVSPGVRWFCFPLAAFLLGVAWRGHPRYGWSCPWIILMAVTAELYHVDVNLGFARHKSYAANPPSLEWLLKNVSGSDRVLGVDQVYPADTLLPNRIRDVRHFDAMYPKLYVDFVDAIWPGARENVYAPQNPTWQRYNSQLLDLAAVRYVLTGHGLPAGGTELIDDIAARGVIETFALRMVNASGSFTIGGENRRILFEHPPSKVEYQTEVTKDAELLFKIGEEPVAWKLGRGDGVLYEVAVRDPGGVRRVLYQRYYDPKHNPADQRWVDGRVDLSGYSGKTITLILTSVAGRDGKGSNVNDWDGWADLRMNPAIERFSQVYADSRIYIYRNNRAVPRIRFVPTARQQVMAFSPHDMDNQQFDAQNEIVIDGPVPRSKDACAAGWEQEVSIKSIRDDPDASIFETRVPCGGFITMADLYYPGWTVDVDGRRDVLYRANYAFRAVHVGPGYHQVAFQYRPWPITYGVPVSVMTAIGSCVVMLRLLRRGSARCKHQIA